MEGERNVGEFAGPAEAARFEDRSPIFLSVRLHALFEAFAGHQLREKMSVDLGGRKGRDFTPVPENRYALCELDDLFQAVTYENDRHAKLLQTPDCREQQLDLMVGQ